MTKFIEQTLPLIAEDIQECIVSTIWIKENDKISEGDPLVELETETAFIELPAEQSGTISLINVKIGDKITVGDLICTFELSDYSNEIPSENFLSELRTLLNLSETASEKEIIEMVNHLKKH